MSKIIVSAHQPNFMPYLGFFDKMQKSDIFVIRDEVLFVKKEFHNRNRIRINSNDNINNPQYKWIGAPVDDPKDFIMHARVIRDRKIKNKIWNENILNEIRIHYNKAPYFNDFFPEIEKIFDNSDDKLVSLNMKIINFLAKTFDIKTNIILASDLKLKKENYEESDASEDLVNICKVLNADVYLSGSGAKEYLNNRPFEKEKIKVEFHDFAHPIYPQVCPNFVPNMCAIDALFCVGKIPEINLPLIKIKQ